jgi:cytochrome c-type biogenesis protein CcsB
MTSLNTESLIEHFLNNLTFVSLLTMTIWYWAKLIFSFRLAAIGTIGVASANLSLSGLLGLRWIESGHFPLSNLYESLLFLAWGFTTFHLLLELVAKVQFMGVVTTPVALLITSFANFSLPKEMQKATALIPALQSNWLMMHVSIMMMSYVALLAGSLLSIAFLVVHFYTRHKVITDVGGVERPPLANEPLRSSVFGTGVTNESPRSYILMQNVKGVANERLAIEGALTPKGEFLTKSTTILPERGYTWEGYQSQVFLSSDTEMSTLGQTLDNLSYRTLGLGFPLLTIGILSGAVWANEAWGSYWSWDPKETWAFITWLVFAIYLHTRLTKGWKGTGPALIAAGGFVIVWICYLGVNLLGTGLHSYGWFQK